MKRNLQLATLAALLSSLTMLAACGSDEPKPQPITIINPPPAAMTTPPSTTTVITQPPAGSSAPASSTTYYNTPPRY